MARHVVPWSREELFAELKSGIQFGFPAFLIFCPRILRYIFCHNRKKSRKNHFLFWPRGHVQIKSVEISYRKSFTVSVIVQLANWVNTDSSDFLLAINYLQLRLRFWFEHLNWGIRIRLAQIAKMAERNSSKILLWGIGTFCALSAIATVLTVPIMLNRPKTTETVRVSF